MMPVLSLPTLMAIIAVSCAFARSVPGHLRGGRFLTGVLFAIGVSVLLAVGFGVRDEGCAWGWVWPGYCGDPGTLEYPGAGCVPAGDAIIVRSRIAC